MKNTIDRNSPTTKINYSVLIAMFIGIIAYVIMNMYEPQIDSQYDFFELMFPLTEFAAGIFALIIAKRYRGAKIFGKAYLALGLGYIFAGLGTVTFGIYEVVYLKENPYGELIPNIFLVIFYLLVFLHLIVCIRHFKKKFTRNDKLLIILLPLITTSFFITYNILPINVDGGIPELTKEHVTINGMIFKLVPSNISDMEYQTITFNDTRYNLIPIEVTTTKYEQVKRIDSPISFIPIVFTNYSIGEPNVMNSSEQMEFVLTIFYFSMITINLSLALIGAQIFRGGILGDPWGLLLFGIILTSVGDIIYFFNAIYTYDKTVDLGFWVFGFMVISYALYLHKKRL